MATVTEFLVEVVEGVLLVLAAGIQLRIWLHLGAIPNRLGISRKYEGLSSLRHAV